MTRNEFSIVKTVSTENVFGRALQGFHHLLNLHMLGLRPHPDQWPPPRDVDGLPTPTGLDRADHVGKAWILEPEFVPAWHHRRSALGAQAYRFEHNEEYDCGWRLASVAHRFLDHRVEQDIDLVTVVPPPLVYARVPVVEWLGCRLADLLDATFRPNIWDANAPLGRHADEMKRLPVAISELYDLSKRANLQGRGVLLIDWRWHRGKMIMQLAKQLHHAGADVVRLAWMK